MRRAAALTAVALLAAGGLPAFAAPAKAPKPVTKAYYLHGTNALGNQDQQDALMTMDAKKPSAATPKDFVFFGAVVSPNSACAGNSLFPNWTGPVSGNLVGTAKVTFYARSTPNSFAKVQLFADVSEQACDSDFGMEYPGVLAEADVALPTSNTPKPVTVTLKIPPKAKIAGILTLQIQPGQTVVGGLPDPQATVISYDGTTAAASITFTCQPAKGRKTC